MNIFSQGLSTRGPRAKDLPTAVQQVARQEYETITKIAKKN